MANDLLTAFLIVGTACAVIGLVLGYCAEAIHHGHHKP